MIEALLAVGVTVLGIGHLVLIWGNHLLRDRVRRLEIDLTEQARITQAHINDEVRNRRRVREI